MEHGKSSLGVASIAIVGLLVAARILLPGNDAQEARSANARGGTVTVSTDWADPPRRAPIQVSASGPSRDMRAILSREAMSQNRTSGFVPVADAATATPVGKPAYEASAGGDPIGRLIRDLEKGRDGRG
jgi:hypothetical protein